MWYEARYCAQVLRDTIGGFMLFVSCYLILTKQFVQEKDTFRVPSTLALTALDIVSLTDSHKKTVMQLAATHSALVPRQWCRWSVLKVCEGRVLVPVLRVMLMITLL